MKPKDDFCIEQESSFLNSIDIFHYCNISSIFILLFLHLLGFYNYLIQSHHSYEQRKIPWVRYPGNFLFLTLIELYFVSLIKIDI